jgi:polyhydroxyalkanoate synthesis regulator phasin
MTIKQGIIVLFCLVLVGCGKSVPPKQVVVNVNDYVVTIDEFEQGFAQSAFAAGDDKTKARHAYLDNLINQKLILQDAQKRDLDKDREFLKSIERFWEQSLLTVAIGVKTKEIGGTYQVPEEQIRKLYDQMVKEGLTAKTYEEMYPQIKWQASKQLEAQMLSGWMDGLRRDARIKINESLLQAQQ